VAILLNNNGYDNESWRVELGRQLPQVPVHSYGTTFDPADIHYALVWNHPAGDLARYPNLRAVFSLGAGAEHLMADLALPDVPVVLLADPAVARDMAAHALFWVLDRHRGYAVYRDQQSITLWKRRDMLPTNMFRVGILGLGRIGRTVATSIFDFGYAVAGWDAKALDLGAIPTQHGSDSFHAFLGQHDVIINCLPLTDTTHHILDDQAFAAMAADSFFVNISRGAIVDDDALLGALSNGRLAGAALDAFAIEPLPRASPYWNHPKVHVTPHMAGATFAASAVGVIVSNMRKLERGEAPEPLFIRAMAS
jgi:glyoxylate/hydroxypyruvate reductase